MFINKDSIVINNVSMGQYITEAKYQYNKLWSSDSGRTLSGKMSGTLVGVFVKITLQFGKLTKSQLEAITPILDSSRQTLTYYDPTKQQNVTMTTYTGDYDITDRYVIENGRTNEAFSCSFIAVQRRI